MSTTLGEYAQASPLIRKVSGVWERWREHWSHGNGKRTIASVRSVPVPLLHDEWSERIHKLGSKGIFFDSRWHLVLKGKGGVVEQLKKLQEIA